jgi:hypothetical protein
MKKIMLLVLLPLVILCVTGCDRCAIQGRYGDGICDENCQKPDPDCADECAQNGLYGDGHCDDWCPQPDPDCGMSWTTTTSNTTNSTTTIDSTSTIIDTTSTTAFIPPSTTTTTEPPQGRFHDNINGTVTDTLTGVVWLKNANLADLKSWNDAKSYCNSLANGMAGLTDGSVAGDWRLPSLVELEGIGTNPPTTYCLNWDPSCYDPTKEDPPITWTSPGAPFTNVQTWLYWTNTSYSKGPDTNNARIVQMSNGQAGWTPHSSEIYVWPVRGGNATTTSTIVTTTTTQQTTSTSSSTTSVRPTDTTTTISAVPSPPSNLTAGAVDCNEINLSWQDNSTNETGFTLERATSSNGPWIIATLGSNVTSTTCLLNPATTYYFRVCAFNNAGNSSWSNIAITATPACPTTTTTIAGRFKDNGDGTVTDTKTGLVWLKDAGRAGLMTWSDAVAFCNSLASGQAGLSDGSVAGDWCLSTKEDLQGIGTDPPTTWIENEPSVSWKMPGAPFINVPGNYNWSSRSYAPDRNFAWIVGMLGGVTGSYSKTNKTYVWPVRDGRQRFKDNNNGTVTDRRTEYVWLKYASSLGKRSRINSQNACDSLNNGQAGLTDGSMAGDWDLPNLTKLESLGIEINVSWDGGYPPVTWTKPGTPFIAVQSAQYGTSTDTTDYLPLPRPVYYTVNMIAGEVHRAEITDEHYVWPVLRAKY